MDHTVIADQFPQARRYLNTASVGLPPRRSVEVLHARIAEWQAGRCEPASFDPDVARARAAYARLVGTTPDRVAIVAQASVVSGLVASSLPSGARVVCATEDFTSVLFPFLVDDRLDVRTVPLVRLAESIGAGTDLVAVSLVQSADGRMIDPAGLVAAAKAAGARTFVDVTQAAGWRPVDATAFDVTSCSAYKWLCCPRGAGFLAVGDDSDWLVPRFAGWYAGADPWQSIYGPPLRLAPDARRFDASPAWLSWAGAVPALELLAGMGTAAIREHTVGLANDFRARLGFAPGTSAIVSIAGPGAGEALAARGFRTAARAGRTRLAFHLYNDHDDAAEAADAVASSGEVSLAGDVAAGVHDSQ